MGSKKHHRPFYMGLPGSQTFKDFSNKIQGLVVTLVDPALYSPVLGFSLSHNTLNARERERPSLQRVQHCMTNCGEGENWTRITDANNHRKVIH